MISFLKFYSSYYFIRSRSIIFSPSGRIVSKMINLIIDDSFILKTQIEAALVKTCMNIICLVVLTFSFIIHLAERQSPIDCETTGRFSSFGNCLWYILMTILTIGYGDMHAVTIVGRFISIMTGVASLLFFGVLIFIVHRKFLFLNKDELKVIKMMQDNI